MGAIVWIAISALVVVLGIVTVTVVAVIAGWKRWNHDNGIFDLETDVSVVHEAFRHLMFQCECVCTYVAQAGVLQYVRYWLLYIV